MRNSKLAFTLLVLGVAACGKAGSDKAASNSATVEANLDAENFNSTLSTDDASMNESDMEQLNGAGG